MKPWHMLILAGLFEVVWATSLKASVGLTRPLPTVITAVALGVSMWLLARAIVTLPLGTAYAVWVGIGIAGTVVLGMVWFDESMSWMRLALLATLCGSIVGLKLTA